MKYLTFLLLFCSINFCWAQDYLEQNSRSRADGYNDMQRKLGYEKNTNKLRENYSNNLSNTDLASEKLINQQQHRENKRSFNKKKPPLTNED